jgi:ribosomal protein S18 acetylase RimI-like enzyme
MHAYRPATLADLPALHRLTDQLANFEVPAWRTREEIARADHAILEGALRTGRDDALVLVAEENAAIVGMVFVTTRQDYFTGQPHGHVEVLAILPEAQGKGLGRALMERAEAWSRTRGYRAMTLNVFDRNQRARALYERLGYAPETIHYWKALD